MGFVPVLAPVLRIVPRAMAVPGGVRGVLVTSGNAVASLPGGLRDVPVWAVGDATAARAVAAGFADVRSAGADAAALAALVRAEAAPGEGALLLASGAGQGMALARELRGAGFRVLRRVAYAAVGLADWPEEVWAALRGGRIGTVLVFSPETGRRVVALLRGARFDVRGLEVLAISEAAAAIVRGLPWLGVRVAPQVNQNALLGLLR